MTTTNECCGNFEYACSRGGHFFAGFTCPPTIYFKFIIKCDKCYYKVRQLFLLQSAIVCYYKVRQLFQYKVRQVLLQSATAFFITKCDSLLLQSATALSVQSATSVITKCDRNYKMWQFITKCDRYTYNKVRRLLQSGTEQTITINAIRRLRSSHNCHFKRSLFYFKWLKITFFLSFFFCDYKAYLVILIQWLFSIVPFRFFFEYLNAISRFKRIGSGTRNILLVTEFKTNNNNILFFAVNCLS